MLRARPPGFSRGAVSITAELGASSVKVSIKDAVKRALQGQAVYRERGTEAGPRGSGGIYSYKRIEIL